MQDLVIVQNSRRLTEEDAEDAAGSIDAVVDVMAVRAWREADLEKSGTTLFEKGWLAWELENIRPAAYNRFVPAKRGLYEVDLNPKYLLHPQGALAEFLKPGLQNEA